MTLLSEWPLPGILYTKIRTHAPLKSYGVYMFKRDRYLNKLIDAMWDSEIKVIVGLRRCGKSTLLFKLFREYLESIGVGEDQILTYELDQRKYYKYRNPITLCKEVEKITGEDSDKKFYLFIDEVQFTQKVKDPEAGDIEISIYDMLNELKSYPNLDVYVTGSNSKMLSKDIATEFRGRSTNITIYPLTFAEYYEAVGGHWRDALDQYMVFGGMPALLERKTERQKMDYLEGLYKKVYISDLVERNKLEREDVMNETLDYISSSISSLTNPTNIANSISSAKREKIYSDMISRYLSAAEDAFLIKTAKRYDIKGGAYFTSPNKYYYTDIGLRNCRLNFRQIDHGHIMENMIFNELVSQGYSVDVGMVLDRSDNKKTQLEVDFVVNSGDKRVYIQSAYQIDSDEKAESETRSLKKTYDFFKKILVRNDIPRTFYDNNGILNCTLFDFLTCKIELF